MHTDERITKDVVEGLARDPRVDAAGVAVTVEQGSVTLSGSVPSHRARRAAAGDAWSVAGVTGVDDRLAVELPAAQAVPSDEEIERAVTATLAWNPDTHDADIGVSVTAGLVRLEGTVEAYWKKWRAEDLVSELRGVIGVEDHLAVAPSGDLLDRDIAEDIESALERDLYVAAGDVTVRVEEGRVVLTGGAATPYARQRAAEAAAAAPGVVEVDNEIAVMV